MKKIVFYLLYMFSVSLLFSQQSALIKVTQPGLGSVSYIFATSEHKNIAQYNIENTLEPIIEAVNTVAFDWLQDDIQRQKMFEIMQFKGENNLKKIYKREDNIRYELMVMDKLKSDVEKYAHTQPVYTMQLFRNLDYAGGIDQQNNSIFQLALNASKPVLSILSVRQIEEIIYLMDYETQAVVLSNYVNNSGKFTGADEENLKNYLNGNLDAIAQNITATQHPAYLSVIGNKKAEIILARIIATAPQQSTLFVIDAGLLGGNTGIIKKLSDAGFICEPVNIKLQKSDAIETVNNENDQLHTDYFPALQIMEPAISNEPVMIRTDSLYAFKNTQKYHALYDPYNDLFDYANADTAFIKNWYDVRGAEANSFIRMPVKSEWQQSNSTSPQGNITSYTYSGNHARSDLFYSIGYTVYPAAFSIPNKADFFTDFVKRQAVKLKGEVLSQRIISTPNYTGREFTVVISDSFFVRSKLILKDNILYQLLCGGPNDNAYTTYADAFFRSFKVSNKIANRWFYYENGLFKCNLPTPPLIGSQTINTSTGPLTLQTYSAEDYKEGISYLVSVYLYPPEHSYGGENQVYDDLVSGAERQYVGNAIKNEKVRKNGMTGRYAELQLSNGKIYKVFFFARNNTVYQYLAGGSALAMQSENPQYFFDTFSLSPDEN